MVEWRKQVRRGSAPKDVSGRYPSEPVVSTICYKPFGALPLPKFLQQFLKTPCLPRMHSKSVFQNLLLCRASLSPFTEIARINMVSYEQIFENNKKWIAAKTAADKDFFKKLSQDQTPEYLYIGCSDSRVTAEELMGARPGEVFIHRNVANVVASIDLNVMSVINYAVRHLRVKHIVVCGHYNCGGVKAAMQSSDLGLLNPWLRNIRDVYRLHKDELNAIRDEHARYDRLVELNVQEQCVNVIKTAVVQQRYTAEGYPLVHGWVFDLRTGLLKDLNIDFPAILHEIQEIYNLTGRDLFEKNQE